MKLYRSTRRRHIPGIGSVATVHTAGCYWLNRGKVIEGQPAFSEWHWAEGKPPRQVFAYRWNVPCKHCRPDLALGLHLEEVS